MDRYIVVEGNVVDGFAFHGGEQGFFLNSQEAIEYAENYLSGQWVIAPIEPAL